MSKQREIVFFECDHMCPVVWVADSWHHIGFDGEVASLCGSVGYRQTGISDDEHYLSKLVRHDH